MTVPEFPPDDAPGAAKQPCPHRMDFANGLFAGGIIGLVWGTAWAWYCCGGPK